MKDNHSNLLSHHSDLSEIRALIEKERETFELTQTILDFAPFVICLWDDNYNVLSASKHAEQMFEISDKQIFVDRFFDFSPEYQPCNTPTREKIVQNLDKAYNDGFSRGEWLHITSSGEPLLTEIFNIRCTAKDKNVLVTFTRDLREVKDAEEESRAKSRFLAHVSHEIRTPMNDILGISEIQLHHNHSEEIAEAFLRIRNSSLLLLSIINNLLDISKVEAGKMDMVFRPYKVSTLIIDIAQLNLTYIGSKQLEFSLEIDPNLPLTLIGDEFRLKQIFNNILSNAFKYTDKGTVIMSFRLDTQMPEEIIKNFDSSVLNQYDVCLTVSVIDTGRGINEHQISRLFNEEYLRFHDKGNYAIEGIGLGMTITYRLVRMMYGHIEVESTPGVGTRFTVRIPQKSTGGNILGEEAAAKLQGFEIPEIYLKKTTAFAREPMPYGHVLIVDDVESNLYVARGLLLPYGLTIETAGSGIETIHKIKSGATYDIIFMDHMMPDIDGIETLKILREMGYDRPIVALTANALVGYDEVFIRNGFSGFISKPIDIRLLNSCLNRFIRDKQPPEAIEAARSAAGLKHKEDHVPKATDESKAPFLRDAHKAMAVLNAIMSQQSIDDSSLKSYSIHTHSIKSALMNIGEAELSDMAHTLEQAGRKADLETIEHQTPSFLTRLLAVIEALTSDDAKEDVAADNDLDFLYAQLQVIQTACETYNKRSADNAIDMLSQKPRSKQTRQLLDGVALHLLHGDFEDAAGLLKQGISDIHLKLHT
ncbi:MAG: ATP-binding protein [Oscillospiraceae bacterium]|nr:ATP-binding protein [Oscillospiraceae bacterium]